MDITIKRSRLGACLVAGCLLVGLVAGCRTSQVTQLPVGLPPACILLPAPDAGADTLTVALHDAADPAREQMLFRQFYETLVTVDCLGGVHAGLAASWKRSDDGRRWTFTLRADARFWNGTPVTAAHVADSWQRALVQPALLDSVAAVGERVLQVYLRRPQDVVPLFLYAPDFAVTLGRLGSGPFRPAMGTGEAPVLQVVEAGGRDLRDLLGGGADLTVTADPGVIEYVSRHAQLIALPLPWDRTYVLLSTARARALGAGDTVAAAPLALSDGVLGEAVRADARAYRAPAWWEAPGSCRAPSAMTQRAARGSGSARRLVYALDDPVARDLAERLVALASMEAAAFPEAAALMASVPGMQGPGPALTPAGVAMPELERQLADGGDFAYVIALPRHPADPCAAAAALQQRVPWLANLPGGFSDVLIPLVDTRPHVVARTGRFGLVVDGYGYLVVLRDF